MKGMLYQQSNFVGKSLRINMQSHRCIRQLTYSELHDPAQKAAHGLILKTNKLHSTSPPSLFPGSQK
jgi:hypothetical protein